MKNVKYILALAIGMMVLPTKAQICRFETICKSGNYTTYITGNGKFVTVEDSLRLAPVTSRNYTHILGVDSLGNYRLVPKTFAEQKVIVTGIVWEGDKAIVKAKLPGKFSFTINIENAINRGEIVLLNQ